MEIEHEFEELGTEIGGGWVGGYYDGKCTIGFDSSGQWWVEDISIDIRRFNGTWRHVKNYLLDRTKPAERALYHQLKSAIEANEVIAISDLVADALGPDDEIRSTISAGRTL